MSADLIHWLSTAAWHRFGSERLASKSRVPLHHLASDEGWKAAMCSPMSICVHSEDGGRQVAELSEYVVDLVLPLAYDSYVFFPIDAVTRAESRKHSGIPSDALVVGVFANAKSPRKGIDLLVEVLEDLSVDVSVHLVVSGRGWDRIIPSLERVVAAVHDLSTEGIGDQRSKFAPLDVYLCTSKVEGGPLPVLEALACGLPVVSTPVGHVPEIPIGPTNLIVGTTGRSLANGLRTVLLRNATTSTSSTSGLARGWRWDSVAPRYAAAYEELILVSTGRSSLAEVLPIYGRLL